MKHVKDPAKKNMKKEPDNVLSESLREAVMSGDEELLNAMFKRFFDLVYASALLVNKFGDLDSESVDSILGAISTEIYEPGLAVLKDLTDELFSGDLCEDLIKSVALYKLVSICDVAIKKYLQQRGEKDKNIH